jgi:hypothetical protein
MREQARQTQPIRKRIFAQCQANTMPSWQTEIFAGLSLADETDVPL